MQRSTHACLRAYTVSCWVVFLWVGWTPAHALRAPSASPQLTDTVALEILRQEKAPPSSLDEASRVWTQQLEDNEQLLKQIQDVWTQELVHGYALTPQTRLRTQIQRVNDISELVHSQAELYTRLYSRLGLSVGSYVTVIKPHSLQFVYHLKHNLSDATTAEPSRGPDPKSFLVNLLHTHGFRCQQHKDQVYLLYRVNLYNCGHIQASLNE